MTNKWISSFLSLGEHCPKLKILSHLYIFILYLQIDCKAFILSYIYIMSVLAF